MSKGATGKPRGAPRGNQNARKHGFYSNALTNGEQESLDTAINLTGIDDEIALLRVKVKTLLSYDERNLPLIIQACRALARLLVVKYQLPTEKKHDILAAVGQVLKDIALPLGIKAGEELLE